MSIYDEMWLKRQSVGNYLSRQLRVLMQNTARNKVQDYERQGTFDTRRAYALPLGRFDVFKQPPNTSDDRMAAVLVIDQSGSMDGQGIRAAIDCAYVFAAALSRLRVPFEVHGFINSYSYSGVSYSYSGVSVQIFKKFEQPMTHRQAAIMSNLASVSGGTYCAEGMAVGWVRLMKRPEPKKVLFVLTDGGVVGNTTEAARAIQRQGGLVIGIGAGVELPPDLFDLSVSVDSAEKLPAAFMKLVRSSLVKGVKRHGR